MIFLPRISLFWLAAIASLHLSSVALAQPAYPSRPVQIVVPFPPGGVADNSHRQSLVRSFRPKDTPPAVVRVLREAARQAVEDTSFKSAMVKVET